MNLQFIEAFPLPAFVISDEDIIVESNRAFQKLFPQSRVGRSYLTVLRQPNLVSLVGNLRSGSKSETIELAIKGSSEANFSATGSRIGANDVLICLQDINETSMAIQMRQNFVTDLSHELRTPLTAILGILQTCEGDPDAIAHFLPTLSGEADRMKRLVDDLLALSRVEANERRSPEKTVTLQEIVAKASAPLSVLAKKAGVRIDTTLPEKPVQFQGDPDELIRALTNLIENALRYGQSGGYVKVTGAITKQKGGHSNLTIEVADDGLGVEPHHIPRLTERFYRVDGHRSRDSGGSGLGLAIVKHIVSHHRGQMKFESQPGRGSTVTLTIPVLQGAS